MKKIALIVGNSEYPGCELNNPVNDANAIEEKFKRLGIDTIKKVNVEHMGFNDSLQEFRDKLSSYEVAIFFFAGHGMQVEGENYLCAINTDFRDENFAKHSSVPLNLALDIMNKSGVYTKIVILDACRNNPYERNFRSAYSRGLAPIYAPLGTIVAYATSPGETASDGNGDNGAYTAALLKHIEKQDLKIEELFKQTRNSLYALTAGKQLSWEHTSLMGDFFFSTSQLTGEYLSNYIASALSDREFDVSGDSEIIDIIRKLQSHDWYKQNPAISKLKPAILEESSINELFVLGRNIYQAACGGAWSVAEYLRNIRTNIRIFEEEQKYHFLNGLAYEIYFNGSGKLRENFKIDFIDIVIPLLADKENLQSGLFINGILNQYDFRLIYDVTGKSSFSFEAVFIENGSGGMSLSKLLFGTKNVLYNYNGDAEYEVESNYERTFSRVELVDDISQKIGSPSSRITITYIGLEEETETFLVPFHYKLLNFKITDGSST